MQTTDDPIHRFAAHVAGTRLADMPDSAIAAAKVLILDTLAVGIGGSAGPMAAELGQAAASMGQGAEARVWGTGQPLPAAGAALVNAYQAHCQEYDSVHEGAVAHVMTAILAASLAGAERQGQNGTRVSGAQLLEAAILGTDVGACLGIAAGGGLRFFRPGTAGGWGAAAALGKLMGLDAGQMVQAFSIQYGQMCGTMQAHTEGSGLLAMQMGFNARNAVTACDLAAAGFTGPENVLTGPFGYYTLFEDGGDPEGVAETLGQIWRVEEVALKPFPSGRATHGILDGALGLQRAHGFRAADVVAVRLSVPPLIEHLVGRPPKTEMAINYARLCARYVLAAALHGQGVAIADFTDAAYRRAAVQDLAGCVTMEVRSGDDPNALVPIGLEIALHDGRSLTAQVTDVYGAPQNPMSPDARVQKVRQMAALANPPLAEAPATRLIELVDHLEDVADVRTLVDVATVGVMTG
ncbi:MAG: MmgE/PrpD family protein [Pseudomonadota bacterium]